MPEVYHTYSERDKEHGFVKAGTKVLLDEGWKKEEVDLLINNADFGSDMYWHCKEHSDIKEEMLEDLYGHILKDKGNKE